MAVEFFDFSLRAKDVLHDKAIAFLHEAAGEILAEVDRNLSQEKGRWHSEQREKWAYIVDDDALEAIIGNPMERSIWTEFGTGEYSLTGKGRQGYWVYVKDENSDAGSGGSYDYNTAPKSYTLEEAKRVMAIMRADGLDAHITKGQVAKRPFYKAFVSKKPKIVKAADRIFGSVK